MSAFPKLSVSFIGFHSYSVRKASPESSAVLEHNNKHFKKKKKNPHGQDLQDAEDIYLQSRAYLIVRG
jgi:hypothetical protein